MVLKQIIGFKFDGLNAGIVAINKLNKSINNSKKISQNFASSFKTGLNSIKDNFNNLKKSVNGFASDAINGFSNIVSGIPVVGTLLSGLVDKFVKVGKSGKIAILGINLSLGPALLLLGAITGAVLLLKRAWDVNIGGIQTTAFKAFGEVKDAFFEFRDAMDKTLKSIAPLFKAGFGVAIGILKGFIDFVMTLGRIFNAMPKWAKIATVAVIGLGLAFKFASKNPLLILAGALLFVFGKLPKPLKIATVAVLGLAAAFTVLSANPIGMVIAGIGLAIWGVIKAFKFLNDKFKIVDKLKKAFEKILSPVKFLGKMFKSLTLPSWLKKVINFFTGGGKANTTEKEKRLDKNVAVSPIVQTTQLTSNKQGNTINNNPNITVNTSREINTKGAKDFANTLSGVIQTQYGAS